MGEDVTKLKKNIDNIKKMVQWSWKDDRKKEGSKSKPEGSKKE